MSLSSKLSKPKPSSLQTLLKSGFTPTLQDFNTFLLFLSQTHKNFKLTTHFFSQMTSNHIKGDSFTHSIFIRSLLSQRKYEAAAQFVKTQMGNVPICRKNRFFDSIIQGLCVDRKDPEKGLLVLQDCLKIEGALPSSFTFRSLIHSLSCLGKMSRAIEVLEMMADEKIRYPFDNFVFSSVICGFVNVGENELAVEFFENAVKAAYLKPNIVTYTAVLSAYCRLGRVGEISQLVSRIEKDGLVYDVVFYSSWVFECFREGDIGEALRKHREMVERKIELDIIGYTVLVHGFSKAGYVEKAVGFLHNMKTDGLKPNLVTWTVIILGLCRKGKLEEAFAVLKMVEDLGMVVDEFVYATLIDGFCRRCDFDRVFSLLAEMEQKGIHRSVLTYNTVINGLCKAGRTSEANEVSKGILGDVVTYSTLLHGYIKEENATGIMEIRRRLEDAEVCMDVVMCNTLIKALFMIGSFADALAFYKGMPEIGLAPDHVTFCTMIDGYFNVGRIDEALEIFEEFQRTTISSVACYNCTIHGLCKKGMIDMAVEVFVELNDRELPLDVGIPAGLLKEIFKAKGTQGILDVIFKLEFSRCESFAVICNNAICFLCKRGFSEAATDVYMVMWRKGAVATVRSYYLILDLLVSDDNMLLSQFVLTSFVKYYGVLDLKTSRIIVHYLCMKDVKVALKFLKKTGTFTISVTILEKLIKKGRVLDSYTLLMGLEDNLPFMDVVDYSIMIDGLCKGGHIGKALDLCTFAMKRGIMLSIITYNSVINGLCHQGCFVEAFRLFDSLGKIDMVPSGITYATLIDALSKEGYLLDARQLFEKMILKGLKPNTRIYNSLIHGYCKLGQLEVGLKLVNDLEEKCLKPDEFTVSAVIYGRCQHGDMEGALESYFDFKTKEMLPDFLGFMYLVRGLCSKGRMEESRGILREMLQSPSVLNLLSRVNTGGETESVEHFLTFLCKQGSIKEAITILDEVGSVFFPIGSSSGAHKGPGKLEEVNDRNVFGMVESKCVISNNETGSELELCNSDSFEQFDFNSCYAEIASLCSRGELKKANKLAKLFFGFKGGS